MLSRSGVCVWLFQTGQQRWWEQEIQQEGNIERGQLITYNLTELIKPEAYQVRLTPITRFGEGDATERIIRYSGESTATFFSTFLIQPYLTSYFI